MPISSLVVRTQERRENEVAEAIDALDGADASVPEPGSSNVVVITETTSREQDTELWELINALPGVVSVSLAYHNFEDLVEGDA